MPASSQELHLHAPIESIPAWRVAMVRMRAIFSLVAFAVGKVIPTQVLPVFVFRAVIHGAARLLAGQSISQEGGGFLDGGASARGTPFASSP